LGQTVTNLSRKPIGWRKSPGWESAFASSLYLFIEERLWAPSARTVACNDYRGLMERFGRLMDNQTKESAKHAQ
jgi:hypothetical protein